MGLFYAGICLIFMGFFFGGFGSLFALITPFLPSDDVIPIAIAGGVVMIVGIIIAGMGLLVAYWLNSRNQFDADYKIYKLCQPFIALFMFILYVILSAIYLYLFVIK